MLGLLADHKYLFQVIFHQTLDTGTLYACTIGDFSSRCYDGNMPECHFRCWRMSSEWWDRHCPDFRRAASHKCRHRCTHSTWIRKWRSTSRTVWFNRNIYMHWMNDKHGNDFWSIIKGHRHKCIPGSQPTQYRRTKQRWTSWRRTMKPTGYLCGTVNNSSTINSYVW